MNLSLLLFVSLVPYCFSWAVKPRMFTPSLYPAEPFNAEADAQLLHTAMGFRTDKFAIINLLTRRVFAQRLLIGQKFKTMYGEELKPRLRSLFFDDPKPLKNDIMSLMTSLPDYYANILRAATGPWGTDEDTIMEVLVPLDNSEIKDVSAAYKRLHGSELVNNLKDDTFGEFQSLLVSLTKASRDEGSEAENENQIPRSARDVDALLASDEAEYGKKNLLFNNFLTTRSYQHLQRMFMEYRERAGYSIENGIQRVFSGYAEMAYLAIVKCARDRPSYFAELLHKAMSETETTKPILTRIVVGRSEIDLGDIKVAYQRMYNTSLAADIDSHTYGNYRELLLPLVGH